MPFEIKSAKATKKEYAERPFTLNSLIGTQFTIEEKLGISEIPRVVNVLMKDGKKTRDGKTSYPVIAITVSDGVFKKDLHIFEGDWVLLCAALPEGIVSLQGVTLRASRDKNNPLKINFEYVGVARQDMEGTVYNNGNHTQEKEAPTTIGTMIKQLHAAIEANVNFGIKNTPEKVKEIAGKIKPGDADGLINAAKEAGWICEVGGVVRGT